MQIRLFGCKIYISLLFIAMITLILLFDRSGLMLLGMGAVAIHETGHLAVMALLKQAPREVILQPAGIVIRGTNGLHSACHDGFVAFAGILFNLLFAMGGALLYTRINSGVWLFFAAANASIGLFNLLPVTGLDGGDILRILLMKWVRVERAELVCRIVSAAVAAALLAAGLLAVFVLHTGGNLLIVAVYLVILLAINMRV